MLNDDVEIVGITTIAEDGGTAIGFPHVTTAASERNIYFQFDN